MSATSEEQRRREEVHALANQLYTNHRHQLLLMANRNAASTDDADEALHDAFSAFIEHFDPDGGAPPLAWLALTLKRRCWARSHHFQATPQQEQPDARIEAMPSGARGTADRVELLIDARERLARLKPAERRALGLIGAGCSYREVTEITGWSHTKVNRCATEGRATLRATDA